MKKRVLSFFISLVVLLVMAPAAVFADAEPDPGVVMPQASYRDGEYEGTGTGRNGEIRMKVTIEDGRIIKIEEISREEDDEYWEEAIVLTEEIISTQSLEVDSISGATRSSDGIKEAVADALKKALIPDNPDAFETGDGSASYPYQILTADQLSAFALSVDEGETYQGKYIALGADIDLSGIDCWNPIGAEADASKNTDSVFDGNFDGAGHTISGLQLTGEHTQWLNAGLFSALNTSARISDLNITAVKIDLPASSEMRVGVLAGDTISNSSGIAAVVDHVGIEGSLKVVSENGSRIFAGGIFGRTMIGTVIANCWTDLSVFAETSGVKAAAYAGGITGMSGNKTVILNSISYGDVYGASPLGDNQTGYAGGISGLYPGMLWNTVSEGNVICGRNASIAHSWAGALVGEMTRNGSYAQVFFAKDAEVILQSWTEGEMEESSLNTASGSSTSITSFLSIEADHERTREEMKTAGFAEALNGNLQEIYGLVKDNGLDTYIALRNWECAEGIVRPDGELWYNAVPDASVFASGTGTEEDPFLIQTAEQLRTFAESLGEALDYKGYYVVIDSDIDLSDEEWIPIGQSEYAFNGTFDGLGHTISGMHKGNEAEAAALTPNDVFYGLFSVLGEEAVVKNVNLKDIFVNATAEATSRIGAVAGYMDGNRESGIFTGAVIDNCHSTGRIQLVQDKGNSFVGGIAAYQYKGAIINCSSDMELSSACLDSSLAEVGGITALVNRGLVANCYSLGNVCGSGNRDGDNEGMGVVSTLVAVDAGTVAGCYSAGNNTTIEFSTYAGTVSGWITGIGKAYSCWYNADSVMTIRGEKVDPVESVGTKVPGGVSEDGLSYNGGIADDLQMYDAASYASVAEHLNAKFSEYPADLSAFGLPENALFSWTFEDGLVKHSSEKGTIIYVQPEAEKYVKPEQKLQEGTWYGRDGAGTTVVQITVSDAEVTKTAVLKGSEEGEAFEEALAVAKEKATYGDFSHYEEADLSRFAGGTGTKEDPYLIENEEQLRYIAYAINEDTDWEGIWFRQISDIKLEEGDWLPIGWALEAEIDEQQTLCCLYPFRGNYDGGGYTIRNLRIGSEEVPSAMMTLGMFGISSGEYDANLEITDSLRLVELNNIHLEDVSIYGKTRYQSYVGGLIGNGQEGISIDSCSVTGNVSSETQDSHCRAGGLFASGLRGKVTNCWTDVDIMAVTDLGRSYAGGLFGMTNRISAVNCFSLGNVSAGAASNNMTFVGGLDGMEGGIHINCYSSGDVTALKTTSGIGANNGLMGGIAVNKASYYNQDAALTAADKPAAMKATGANYSDATDEAEGKSAAEISSEAFAEELNANIRNISGILKAVQAELEGGSHLLYYTGDGSDLTAWKSVNGIVCFATDMQEKDIKETNISLAKKSVVYNGKAQNVKVTVRDGSTILKQDIDYTVSYKNNKKVGTATVVINGKGSYSGSVKKTFRIVPKKTTISKLTAKKKSVSVKWKKQTAQTGGYQIQYSLKKNFRSGNKTVTVKGPKKTSRQIKKLKSGKTYYVRIRTLKKTGGVTYYSSWSKAKKVKVK